MIKKGFFSFLKCLKYYFVPLGILSIFTLIGLSIGVTGIVRALETFFSKVAEMVNSIEINWNGIWGALVTEFSKLNLLNDLSGGLAKLFSSEWITNTLAAVAREFFGESITMEQIQTVVATAIVTIVINLIIFILFIILGIVVGIFTIKLLLRKELTRVKMGKLILFSVLDALFWLAYIIVINLLGSIAPWVNIIVLVITILSFAFVCLIEGYLFYARKKIPFKKVVHIKNVLKLYVIEIMVFAITAVITVLSILIFKIFIGLYIALPFIEIGIIAMSLEAENYVVNMVDEVSQPSDFILRGNYEKKI